MEKRDGDSGKLMSEINKLPPLTIGNQDDRKYWNQARVLATTGGNTKIQKEGILNWFEDAVQRFNVPDDAKVLDLGCGPGRFTKGMQQLLDHPDWQITAIDGSIGMINIAKQNIKNLLPEAKTKKRLCKVEFKHLNAMDMNFKDEFDVIWTCTVLQHNSFINKRIILPKMYNALKHGGYYIALEGVKTEKAWVDPLPDCPEGYFKKYKCEAPFTSDWVDERGCKGTSIFWINNIGQFGFELYQYGYPHIDFFVFRKMREVGKFKDRST